MSDWKPRNLGGGIYYDPKDELGYWLKRAGNDPMVAVPVETLRAAHRRRECDATTVLTGDEDGPLTPMTVRCRRQDDHAVRGIRNHSNGFCEWQESPAAVSSAATGLADPREASRE